LELFYLPAAQTTDFRPVALDTAGVAHKLLKVPNVLNGCQIETLIPAITHDFFTPIFTPIITIPAGTFRPL